MGLTTAFTHETLPCITQHSDLECDPDELQGRNRYWNFKDDDWDYTKIDHEKRRESDQYDGKEDERPKNVRRVGISDAIYMNRFEWLKDMIARYRQSLIDFGGSKFGRQWIDGECDRFEHELAEWTSHKGLTMTASHRILSMDRRYIINGQVLHSMITDHFQYSDKVDHQLLHTRTTPGGVYFKEITRRARVPPLGYKVAEDAIEQEKIIALARQKERRYNTAHLLIDTFVLAANPAKLDPLFPERLEFAALIMAPGLWDTFAVGIKTYSFQAKPKSGNTDIIFIGDEIYPKSMLDMKATKKAGKPVFKIKDSEDKRIVDPNKPWEARWLALSAENERLTRLVHGIDTPSELVGDTRIPSGVYLGNLKDGFPNGRVSRIIPRSRRPASSATALRAGNFPQWDQEYS